MKSNLSYSHSDITRFAVRFVALICLAVMLSILTACGSGSSNASQEDLADQSQSSATSSAAGGHVAKSFSIQFGQHDAQTFIADTEDNATAHAIATYISQSQWQLPIYHFDGFANADVMQYYDIPDSYSVPSTGIHHIQEEQIGDIYYSHPNRVILFYQDAKVAGDYIKIAHINNTQGLTQAVRNNPVVEGWSNKVIQVKATNDGDTH